ncbi:MAG: endonuclease/exonuclease/phosphatase family protein [Candidatus Aminicenantes bacterium]
MRKGVGLAMIGCTVLSFLLLACGPPIAEAPAEEAAAVRVMSFNIRFDNLADGANAWPLRKEMAAGVIDFHRVDVAGLQEALASQIKDLETLLPGYAWVGVGRDDGLEAGEFCPVFFRKDRFRLLESSTFWLSEEPQTPGLLGWDAACARVVTRARLRDLWTGRTLTVFNTHFDHIGETARRESAALVLAAVRKVAPGESVVLTGDLNCSRTDEPYKALVGTEIRPGAALRDARDASRRPPFGPLSSFNGFRTEARVRPPIDHIFVGPGIEVTRAGVLPGAWDGRFVSDHNPVLAELVLARR